MSHSVYNLLLKYLIVVVTDDEVLYSFLINYQSLWVSVDATGCHGSHDQKQGGVVIANSFPELPEYLV